MYGELGQSCACYTIDVVVDYTHEREDAFGARAAVLVHGDPHPENVLQAKEPGRFNLIDPEGLASEPAMILRGCEASRPNC